MPKQVEETYQKKISKFVWNDKHPAVNRTDLSTPMEEGGLHLLNIQARNEAIDLMWVKKYLDTSNKRPL